MGGEETRLDWASLWLIYFLRHRGMPAVFQDLVTGNKQIVAKGELKVVHTFLLSW